ncbi:hypothetical protein DLAC_11822 [Tieghemostelium lacteum]|uniref:Uncharacterized protein n=1 Tax=Tieghemostelium lacteum TaxID=361077 RepID=A0A151Z4N0_TIELA|nr:hypothetical protein DLAC_11822 [Tieghemostelium lacteum]|eukprot:KYQ88877.1 hypothetical protein DLAC_11822 [Tieghemostelium lacteum]
MLITSLSLIGSCKITNSLSSIHGGDSSISINGINQISVASKTAKPATNNNTILKGVDEHSLDSLWNMNKNKL